MYMCVKPGTTAASGGPTGTIRWVNPANGYSASITDGTAIWVYCAAALVMSSAMAATSISSQRLVSPRHRGAARQVLVLASPMARSLGPITARKPRPLSPSPTPRTMHHTQTQYTITIAADTLIPNTITTPFRIGCGAPSSGFLANTISAVGADTAPNWRKPVWNSEHQRQHRVL